MTTLELWLFVLGHLPGLFIGLTLGRLWAWDRRSKQSATKEGRLR